MKNKAEVENPNDIPVKIIADSIVAMASAVRKMNSSRLTREALVYLLHKKSGVGIGQVESVLWALDNLETHWLKKAVVK